MRLRLFLGMFASGAQQSLAEYFYFSGLKSIGSVVLLVDLRKMADKFFHQVIENVAGHLLAHRLSENQ
ncbi:hypothetical protein P7E02_17335 [Enterococcus hulanensis]|uniref:hypothetical protein n=1 Tax=Enterococcus hulanensis TaxID=2559929 RepID=UPI002890DBC3|nr:hypothetical protein [Enterococcus hulanensis]MDT2661643.1 hypothetical protein [Enterococcus hulanensis]